MGLLIVNCIALLQVNIYKCSYVNTHYDIYWPVTVILYSDYELILTTDIYDCKT